MLENHKVVSRDEWIEARKQLLVQEKAFSQIRDRLSQQRRDLPWVRVDKDYVFEGPAGKESLSALFADKRQLIVYHFMFDPGWEAGCKHCSFWADNFNGIGVHLAHRDVSMVVISRAPLAKIEAFRRRMGWSFPWFSAFGSDFNYDFGVSFTPEARQGEGSVYNYTEREARMADREGVSVFCKDAAGAVFHTYSTYSRGIDLLNGAYNYLDLVPKGRDEDHLDFTQSWVRYHDQYED